MCLFCSSEDIDDLSGFFSSSIVRLYIYLVIIATTLNTQILVLDEADEMLNKGFKEQIYDVYRYLPPATQVVLISATLPHEILEMTSKFMTDPVRILVKR